LSLSLRHPSAMNALTVSWIFASSTLVSPLMESVSALDHVLQVGAWIKAGCLSLASKCISFSLRPAAANPPSGSLRLWCSTMFMSMLTSPVRSLFFSEAWSRELRAGIRAADAGIRCLSCAQSSVKAVGAVCEDTHGCKHPRTQARTP